MINNQIFHFYENAKREYDAARAITAEVLVQLNQERGRASALAKEEANKNPLFRLLSQSNGITNQIYKMKKQVEDTYVDWYRTEDDKWDYHYFDTDIQADAYPIETALSNLESLTNRVRFEIYDRACEKFGAEASRLGQLYQEALKAEKDLEAKEKDLYRQMDMVVIKHPVFRAKITALVDELKSSIDLHERWDTEIVPVRVDDDNFDVSITIKFFANFDFDTDDRVVDEYEVNGWSRHEAMEKVSEVCSKLQKFLDINTEDCYTIGATDIDDKAVYDDEDESFGVDEYQPLRYFGHVQCVQEFSITFKI